MAAQLRIGISGWQYDGWRGAFYPEGMPQRHQLAYAARLLNSIEVNGTFYSLKSPDAFDAWFEQTPDDFLYDIKGSRYVTHTLRLREPTVALANFFANGLLRLGRKLGPILWQLPPNMQWEPDVFAAFCEMLPKNARDAAKLAGRHDRRVEGRAWYDTDSKQQIRHAFEVRDPRMMNDRLVRTLRDHGHALAFADAAGRYPYSEDITAGFIYLRLHGAEELYTSGYDDDALDGWARRIKRWMSGGEPDDAFRLTDARPPARKHRDVYVYFDNDVKVHAPFNALSLAARLGRPASSGDVKLDGGGTFPPPPRLKG